LRTVRSEPAPRALLRLSTYLQLNPWRPVRERIPGTLSWQIRWSAPQFDDDRNELSLAGYIVADVFASYPLSRPVTLTLGVENVLDEEIEVGATPVVTLGQPRAWSVGFRYVR
jgi:outer membrane receptor for ferric coprogen and ferric-rhodotorulic acid